MLDATSLTLERSLDLRMKEHAIRASNIANANVPNFKAKKIDFEERLSEALEGSSSREPLIKTESKLLRNLNGVAADVYEDPFAVASGDGNTVNVDQEQAGLAKNTIAYQGAIQLLNKRFAMQKYVLSEGGR